MHGVVVIPAPAPDEAVLLEQRRDLDWNAVLVRDGAALAGLGPAPVVGVADVDVERDAERMLAQLRRAGDHPPVEPAARLQRILAERRRGLQRIRDVADRGGAAE